MTSQFKHLIFFIFFYELKIVIYTKICFQLGLTMSSSQPVSQKTWGDWRQLNHRLASPK